MNEKTYKNEITDQLIKKLFYYSLNESEQSIKFMTFLIDYDKSHNNFIDFKNESFLTHIQKHRKYDDIEEIVNFVIEKGDDVNRPNDVESNFEEFVCVLLKTKKVNYNQVIVYDNISETYLHLSARNYNHKILEMILNLNVFDINARNSENETPLMMACRNLTEKNVEILFQNDELDFCCKNSNNEDALEIAQNSIQYLGNDNENISREQYFAKLKEIFNYNYDEIIDYGYEFPDFGDDI